MRKIINSTFITLDGVIQDPHLWPSLGTAGAEASFEIQNELLQGCDVLLMGRRTYESFASVWPTRTGDAFSDRINTMQKYVVSSTLKNPSWRNTKVLGSEFVSEIRKVKQQPGGNILEYGLGPVSFSLIGEGLMDEIRLWVHPLILGGKGPQIGHFRDCPLTQLHLGSTKTLPNGIAILCYQLPVMDDSKG